MTGWRQQGGLLAGGVICGGGYLGLVALHWRAGTLRAGQAPETVGWFLLAGAGFAIALLWAERRPVPMRTVWVGAVLFRLLLLLTPPTLSDDVYRYLWDGRLIRHGVSPYAHPIAAPALDYLDHPVRTRTNNPEMASPYLPAAQGLFALVPAVPTAMQLAMVLIDLSTGWLLARLLPLARLPAHRLLLYLWHPLVIVEVAHGAHVDAWMVLLMLLAIWATLAPAGRYRAWVAPMSLALAVLTKILPLLALPVLGWRWSWRQRLAFGAAAALLLAPFGWQSGWGLTGPADGRGLFGALRLYTAYWEFNGGLYYWLDQWISGAIDDVAAAGWGAALSLSRLAAVGGLIPVLLAAAWQARSTTAPRPLLRLLAIPFMAYVLLTPTLHPWYLLALLVLLPFWPPAPGESGWRWLSVWPWYYLSGAVFLSYLTYLQPAAFAELPWVRRLTWLPTLALLAPTALVACRRRQDAAVRR